MKNLIGYLFIITFWSILYLTNSVKILRHEPIPTGENLVREILKYYFFILVAKKLYRLAL